MTLKSENNISERFKLDQNISKSILTWLQMLLLVQTLNDHREVCITETQRLFFKYKNLLIS